MMNDDQVDDIISFAGFVLSCLAIGFGATRSRGIRSGGALFGVV